MILEHFRNQTIVIIIIIIIIYSSEHLRLWQVKLG